MSDYLTAEQYEYARKTGDWESGKFLTHGQALNENQQIVLDVLKKNANQGLDELIVGGITYMSDEEINAIELSQQEELFQVLASFAEWGMKNDQED